MQRYYIKQSEEMGRGLYAISTIPKGRVLFSNELLVLSEADTKKLQDTDLKYYTFAYNNKQDCLVLGDGELFNHSNMANVGYKLEQFGPRKVMTFYALRDIGRDQQLFINYNADGAYPIETMEEKNMIGA